MKNRLLFGVFACFLNLAGTMGQINRTFPFHENEYRNAFISDGADGWIFAAHLEEPSGKSSEAIRIVHLRADGSTARDFPFSTTQNQPFSIATSMKLGPTGKLFVAGYFLDCDTELGGFVAQIDTSGQVDWQRETTFEPIFIQPNSDGSVVFINYTTIQKYSVSGELLRETYWPVEVWGVDLMASGSYIGYADNKLYVFDSLGTLLKNYTVDNLYWVGTMADGSFVMVHFLPGSGDVLSWVNGTTFQIMNSIVLNDIDVFSVKNLTFFNDEVWFLSYDFVSGLSFIIHLDKPSKGFKLIEKITLGDRLHYTTSIAFNKNYLGLTGVEFRNSDFYFGNPTQSLFVQTSPISNLDFSSPIDIGIEDFRTENGPFLPQTAACQKPDSIFDLPTGRIFVKIRNHGSQAVDSFRVSIYLQPALSICGMEKDTTRLFHTHLESGEAVELPFGELILPNQLNDGFLHLCGWTSRPDFRVDNDHLNDNFCRDFGLLDPPKSVVVVAPNPAADCFEITAPGAAPSLPYIFELFNAAGQLLFSETMPTPSLQVMRNGLPNGLYFWRVLLDDGTRFQTGKVIFQ